ncbi:hypothetical protein D9C01_13060, partial [Corynebacterium diphtheriae]
MEDGRQFQLDHGAVSIASITSCTNTSNPSVMMATVVPSISGPKRPQDRIELSDSKDQFRKDLHNYATQDEAGEGRPSKLVDVSMEDGRQFQLDHGAVSIASITSCTNTSNPSVMMA